tara:strand:- start:30 stop:215 length:186 start_codon:yes stop_codon:yes gene_type:complete
MVVHHGLVVLIDEGFITLFWRQFTIKEFSRENAAPFPQFNFPDQDPPLQKHFAKVTSQKIT